MPVRLVASQFFSNCSCCGFYCMTKFKRLVNNIFPQNKASDGLEANDLSKLTFYVVTEPQKLDRVFDYLSKKTINFLKHNKQWPFVILSLQAMTELMKSVPEAQIVVFVDVYLRTLESVLSACSMTGATDFQVIEAALESLSCFCDIPEQNIQYCRDYRPLVNRLCSFCSISADPNLKNLVANHAQYRCHRLRLAGLRGLTFIEHKLHMDSQNSIIIDSAYRSTTVRIFVPILRPLKDSPEWITDSKDLLSDICQHAITVSHFKDLCQSAANFVCSNFLKHEPKSELIAHELTKIMIESGSESSAGYFAATALTGSFVCEMDDRDTEEKIRILEIIADIVKISQLTRFELINDLDHIIEQCAGISPELIDCQSEKAIVDSLFVFCTCQCLLNQTLVAFVHLASVRQKLFDPVLNSICDYICRTIDLEFRPDKLSAVSLIELSAENIDLASLCMRILIAIIDRHGLSDRIYEQWKSRRFSFPNPISKSLMEAIDDMFAFDHCWTHVLDALVRQPIIVVPSKLFGKLLTTLLYEFVLFRFKDSKEHKMFRHVEKTLENVLEIIPKYNDTRAFVLKVVEIVVGGDFSGNEDLIEQVLKWTKFVRTKSTQENYATFDQPPIEPAVEKLEKPTDFESLRIAMSKKMEEPDSFEQVLDFSFEKLMKVLNAEKSLGSPKEPGLTFAF